MCMTDLSYGTVQVVCKYSAVPVANSGGVRGVHPLAASYVYICVHNLQWWIQRGFTGSMEPLFWRAAFENTMHKRCTYTTLATHFSFNSSNNARVSNPVSRIRLAHGLHAHRYYQKHMETWWKPWKQWTKRASELKLIHALLPLQLGMAICNHLSSHGLRG